MAKVFACIIVLAIAVQLSTFPAQALPTWSSYLKIMRDGNLPRLGNIDEEGDNFEGDIIPSAQVKSGVKGDQFRWPGAIVPIIIAPTFSENDKKVIRDALQGIEAATCLKFIPRTTESDYIQVQNTGNGCSSNVGRQGGSQRITLGLGCVYYGIVQHEFIHASGFYHEHSRSDRDKFVDIIWPNILLPFWPQFFTQDNDINFGVPYDYGSVMHYSRTAFATIPFVPTIVPKQRDAQIGQREGMSKLDILKLNRMYNCTMA